MNENMIYPLSSYQVDYLRDLFRQEGMLPAKIEIQSIVFLGDGRMAISMIKYGGSATEYVSRYPQYKLPDNLEKYFNQNQQP